MASHILNEIFDKITSADKDFRFMATSDLLNELQRETVRMDYDTERRVCTIVLQRMQDSAGEISEMAVKCLSVLLPKIHEPHLADIAQTLTTNFLSERKEGNDIHEVANLGLKTMIESISSHTSAGATVIGKLTPQLIKGMETKNDDTMLMSLDIAREFVLKYGSALESHGDALLKVFLALLSESRAVIRKKATSCIGVLSLSLTDVRLQDLFSMLLNVVRQSEMERSALASHVQTIGVVGYAVGNRVGKHIDEAVTSVLQRIEEATEEDVELLESCIRALESFVSRSSMATRPFLDAIIDVCIRFLQFDPNYVGDVDASVDDEMGSDYDEDDMYSEEEAFSDDEDESWKVRKAAASCLNTVFLHNTEQIQQIYQKVAPVLISRFNEREENVKLDVLLAYITLLSRMRLSFRTLSGSDMASVLEPTIPALMKMISRQLNDKSVKTRLQTFRVLKEIAVVVPSQVTQNIQTFVQPIARALKEGSGTSSDLKIEVLTFLRAAMSKSTPTEFQSALPQIAPVVFEAVNERYYKVTSAALIVCDEIVHIIRPSPDTIVDDALTNLISPLLQAVMTRFQAQDVDQEVKEFAIRCMADVVACLGDMLTNEIDTVMQIMLERLTRQTTQLTAVKALAIIGSSPLNFHLNNIDAVLEELTIFLKKANVALRQAALRALNVLCQRKELSLSKVIAQGIVAEAAVLVTDQDMHLAANSLELFCTVALVHSASKRQIRELVVPRALDLVQSPLLQGSVLQSLQRFFVSMAEYFSELFQKLMKEVPGRVQQQSTARCVAAMCCLGKVDALPSTIQTLLKSAKESQSEIVRRLALLCLGEIGRLTSLDAYPQAEELLTQSLEDASEDVKYSASYALGALTLGNVTLLLPKLVEKIQASRTHQRQLYLLLLSLNEVIAGLNLSHTPTPLSNEHVVGIRDMLLSSEDLEEDGRNIASECIGQLALLHPELMLSSLKNNIKHNSENIRYMIVSGVRYTIVDQPHPVDTELRESMPLYMEQLSDPSRHVRKAAVQLLSSTLAHKYHLVQDCLSAILPKLYEQTVKRDELIRVLDFGPFKHRIDDGIELRKATFECMNLLLDAEMAHINIQEFVQHLCTGLADVDDIKLLCYPMLIKLCTVDDAVIISFADKIAEPLQKTLTKNVSSDAVKRERERHQELIRSCLRAVDAMNRVEGVPAQKGMKRMMDSVVNRGDMRTIFQEIQKERSQAAEDLKSAQDSATLYSVLHHTLSGSPSL